MKSIWRKLAYWHRRHLLIRRTWSPEMTDLALVISERNQYFLDKKAGIK